MTCATDCRCDTDHSGNVDADDLFAFLDYWFAQNGTAGLQADFDLSGWVDPDDLFAFLDCWFLSNNQTCD